MMISPAVAVVPGVPHTTTCEPLWGPEKGSTLVLVHGEAFDLLDPRQLWVLFGSSAVPCDRVSDTLLRCRAPAHGAGIVDVRLRRCEGDGAAGAAAAQEAGDVDLATFEFVRLEAAYDQIFARTNSFCPFGSPSAPPSRLPAAGAYLGFGGASSNVASGDD